MNNLDALVNKILAEAFVTEEEGTPPLPEQTHPNVQKEMLAGEMVSSPAYFFQPPVADTHQQLNGLLASQAEQGLGDLVLIGQAVNDFVEAYLQDTAVEMYTNSNNVEYLINSLRESGYEEYASALDAITLDPKIDDVAKINKMVEALSKESGNEYFTESLVYIAGQIVEEEDSDSDPTSGPAGEGAGAAGPNSDSPGTSEGEPANGDGKSSNGGAATRSETE